MGWIKQFFHRPHDSQAMKRPDPVIETTIDIVAGAASIRKHAEEELRRRSRVEDILIGHNEVIQDVMSSRRTEARD